MEVLWAVTPVTYEFIIPEVLLSVSQLTKNSHWSLRPGVSWLLHLMPIFAQVIPHQPGLRRESNSQTHKPPPMWYKQWSLQSSKEFQPEEGCCCWEPITHLGGAALSRPSRTMAKPTSADETACLSKMLLSGRVVVHALFKQCPKLNSASLSGPLDSSCLTLAVWKFGPRFP